MLHVAPLTRVAHRLYGARLQPVTLLLAGAAIMLAACGGAAGDATPAEGAEAIPPVPVVLDNVAQDAVAQPVTATGAFGPKDEVSLSFKIGGIVARVAVDEGATVQRGAAARRARPARDRRAARARRASVWRRPRATPRACAALLRRQRGHALAAAGCRVGAGRGAGGPGTTAAVNREYAVITAPVSGRILRRRVQPVHW